MQSEYLVRASKTIGRMRISYIPLARGFISQLPSSEGLPCVVETPGKLRGPKIRRLQEINLVAQPYPQSKNKEIDCLFCDRMETSGVFSQGGGGAGRTFRAEV